MLFDVSLRLRARRGRRRSSAATGPASRRRSRRSWAWSSAARRRAAFAGQPDRRLPTYRIARLGLGYVPEDRRIFTDLTVAENLEVGRRPPRAGRARPGRRSACSGSFPNLAEMRGRRGNQMSGGEQQMLAIARTLMGNPDAILLDEPSEGLAP